ncbi:SAM-dependent methyltransferase [Leptolyngbya sp. 7M]|uniref:SAM-dependent methyltransferase n=1 Tax=Leptolyngbya sp. 7M TaxID=2812896 RepID=UPI001B8C0C92|nr:cyclopropane-fatty-acyl-phospholipid synthase family protein [Leptolyngbya sp. 7M]QYO63640.1 cyclopropane-fatty-acyl-phospholipid synthase family protein [Leptolyngbya sp. 7M]
MAYWLARNTRSGSRRNIVAHYDLSNEFFSTFLDRGMVYSSAFYRSGAESLEAAQVEKMDRACRKLRLCADDHLLEIGTGWGSLAVHAASRYGCRVTTTTISDKQYEAATRRVEAAGLSERVRVVRQDYRDLGGTYDKLVSIEMIEAVGREYLGTFVGKCSSLLSPRGLALIQGITIRDRLYASASRRVDFLKKYIFPGSCLVGSEALTRAVARHGDLEIVHAEHFGEHYARTLSDWRGAFLANLGVVRRLGYDDRFIRMWDYYLAYCEGAMRARRTGVAQWLLAKPHGRGGSALTWGPDWGDATRQGIVSPAGVDRA